MKYSKEFVVRNFDANKYGMICPVSLLKYLGEMAILHSEAVDINMKDLKEENRGWMIYKWKVQMEDYPKAGEKFRIETWSSRLYKFYANREFTIYNKDDEVIGRASSLWLYVDMKRKMPVRIPKEFNEHYGLIEEMNFEDFDKLDTEVEMKKISSFHVRATDIDYNQHVNNASYFEWMLEALLQYKDISGNYFPHEFNIEYKKETMYGETIDSEVDVVEKDNKLISNHRIINTEDQEHRTYGKMIWLKR